MAIAPIDEFTVTEFTTGACGYLAAALHRATGWPIVAEFDGPLADDVAHIWVENECGFAVDINGIHKGSWARTKYSGIEPGRIEKIPLTMADGPDTGFVSWAEHLVRHNQDYFGIHGLKIDVTP
jgi:hypothetical protein